MKVGWIIGVSALAATVSTASAQDTYHWPVPAQQNGRSVRTYFPAGTPIALRMRTEANTKQAKPGERVYLETVENLVYRGQVVVPAGSPAIGEVVRSERNGHFGKKGQIEIRVMHVQTPHGPVRLGGGATSNGTSATAWSVPVGVLMAWPVFFVHGTSGYIRQGTVVNAFMAEPLTFDLSPVATQTASMAVPDESARPLPARFDPSVFGRGGPGFASR